MSQLLNDVASEDVEIPYVEVSCGQVRHNSVPSMYAETIQTLLASLGTSGKRPLSEFREHHDSSEGIVVDCA